MLLWAHHEKAEFTGKKTMMPGKTESSRKRGRPNMGWTDFLKESTDFSLQGLSIAVEDRTFWGSLIHRIAMNWRQPDGT